MKRVWKILYGAIGMASMGLVAVACASSPGESTSENERIGEAESALCNAANCINPPNKCCTSRSGVTSCMFIRGDVDNCGDCGIVCSSNHIAARNCWNGVCDGDCATGYGDCDSNKQTNGCETNLNTDPDNCHDCGHPCSNNHMATRTCSGGVCGGTCATGYGDCNGDPSDGCESPLNTNAHCGSCSPCATGYGCVSNSCVAMPDLVVTKFEIVPNGSDAQAQATIKNQGAASAGVFTVDIAAEGTAPSGWSGLACSVGALAAGAECVARGDAFGWTPATLAAAQGAWVITADAAHVVSETNEGNNTVTCDNDGQTCPPWD